MQSLDGPRRRAPRAALLLAAAACATLVVLAVTGPLAGGSDATGGSAGALDRDASTARDGGARPEGPEPAASHRAPERADTGEERPEADRWPGIRWRDSVAIGLPTGGELVRGVRLPEEGRHFFTWDPVQKEAPNRWWRRVGTDHAIRATLDVLSDHRRAFPRAPRLGIGDVSRPRGGDFGTDYGPIGHVSHQNGLDVDVYYPLESGRERAPLSVEEIDLGLSQDLVDRFVAAGAEKVFVGPSTGLSGPPGIVQAIPNHDNHLHARFPAEG